MLFFRHNFFGGVFREETQTLLLGSGTWEGIKRISPVAIIVIRLSLSCLFCKGTSVRIPKLRCWVYSRGEWCLRRHQGKRQSRILGHLEWRTSIAFEGSEAILWQSSRIKLPSFQKWLRRPRRWQNRKYVICRKAQLSSECFSEGRRAGSRTLGIS